MINLLIVAVAVLVICFYRWPGWGLALLVALLPFEDFGTFSLNPEIGYPVVRPAQIVGVALIVAYGLRVLRRKEAWPQLDLPFIALGLFALWALYSAMQINYPPLWRDYLSALFVFGLCFCSAQLLKSVPLRYLKYGALVGLAAVIGLGSWQFVADLLGVTSSVSTLSPAYSHPVLGYPRIHSTLAEPLFLANFLLAPLLTSLAMVIRPPTMPRRHQYFILAALGTIFILTVSKGGYVAFTLGILTLCWLMRRAGIVTLKAAGKKLAVVLAAALAVGVIFITINSLTQHRSFASSTRQIIRHNITQLRTSGTYRERGAASSKAIQLLGERPLSGFGLGGYTYRLHDYPANRSSRDRVAVNNQYLEIAAETGWLGLGFYLAFLGSIISLALKALHVKQKLAERTLLAGLTSGLAAVWFQYFFFSAFYLSYIWVLSGLVVGLSARILMPMANQQQLRHKVRK